MRYRCGICGQICKNKGGLNSHIYFKHGKEFYIDENIIEVL